MLNVLIIFLFIIFNIIFQFINLERTLWIDYIIILGLGGQINPLIIYAMLFSMIIIIIFSKYIIRKKKVTISILMLVLISLLFVGYIATLMNSMNRGHLATSDAWQYLRFILIFFISASYFEKKSMNKFINCTLIGVLINSIIIAVLYRDTGGRYATASESMYIFTIPVQLYILYSKRYTLNYKLLSFIATIIQIILIILSQSRTNSIMLIFEILALIMFGLILKRHNFINLFRHFSKIIIISLILIIGLISMGKNYNIINSDFINRFSEISDGYSNAYSYEVRKLTNDYYSSLIELDWKGYGFGTYMPNVTMRGAGYEINSLESFQTDNLLITHLYKVGIFTTSIFIIIFIVSYIKLILHYIKYKKLEYAIFIIILPFFYIGTAHMTSQMIHNIPISMFIWMFIGIMSNDKMIK